MIWSIGGSPLAIHFSLEGLTAWAEDKEGRVLPGVMAYQRGWLDFYPDSKVFSLSDFDR